MGVLMLNDINYSGGGGAEEMTLAQYNALSQAEKNDGKIRFITDVEPDDSNLIYPTLGSGIEITNTDKSNPFVLPAKSVVRLLSAANESTGLGLVMKDKSDYLNVITINQSQPLMVGIILEKGSMVIRSGTGTSSKLYYTSLEA